MSKIHILKNTETEAVVKVYTTEQPDTIDLDLETWLTTPTQVYVPGSNDASETDGHFAQYTGSHVFITGIWWGLKVGKQLDIQRVIDPVTPIVHSHYYLVNAGEYNFDHHGFADRIYANKDIRFVFDGPGHCILKLRKMGWQSKVETAQFSIYDNTTVVGS
jgi:hypothetical protein